MLIIDFFCFIDFLDYNKVKDFLSFSGGLFTLGIAYRALYIWRNQYFWKDEYDLTKTILRSLVRVRKLIFDLRYPISFVSGASRVEELQRKKQKLSGELEILDSHLEETEIFWGSIFKEARATFFKDIYDLEYRLQELLEAMDNGDQNAINHAQGRFYTDLFAKDKDELSIKLSSSVGKLDQTLRTMRKRKGIWF